MPVKYDLITKGEKYTNKNGEEKVKWIKCGVVLDTKSGGQTIFIESLPIQFDGWLMMKERTEQDNYLKSNKSKADFDDMESDMPF